MLFKLTNSGFITVLHVSVAIMDLKNNEFCPNMIWQKYRSVVSRDHNNVKHLQYGGRTEILSVLWACKFLKISIVNINLSPVFVASVSNFTSISWHPVYLLSCGLALKCWPWNERKWPSNIDDHGANFLLLVHFTDFFRD